MPNRVAVSLAPPDTEICLAELRRLAGRAALAEVRLDLMERFDLPRLIAESPIPLIITCRPPREMGRFAGDEADRLAILAQAIRLGAAYVDVEWDSVDALAALGARPRTRVVASRHWTDRMPADLWPFYEDLRARTDAVKLVGMAARPADMLPVFELLARAPGPLIAIAMGEAGRLTRLLAPCFASCLLTYGAATPAGATAAGQFSVADLTDAYRLQHVGPQTAVQLHLCADAASAEEEAARNAEGPSGAVLHAPLVADAAQAAELLPGLRACLPQITVNTHLAVP